MANSTETFRSIFRERVLPNFHHTKARFDKYFKQSCELLKALPIVSDQGFMRFHPFAKEDAGRNKGLEVKVSDLYFAFCALGIKPLATSSCFNEEPFRDFVKKHGPGPFKAARLEWSGGMMFDPVLCAPILSKILNRKVDPKDVGCAIQEANFGDKYPHELLGYPERVQENDPPMGFFVDTAGFLDRPSAYYVSHFGCSVWNKNTVLPHLEAWASAAALVEDIREAPESISIQAALEYKFNKPGHKTYESVKIKRSDKAGEWSVIPEESSDRLVTVHYLKKDYQHQAV